MEVRSVHKAYGQYKSCELVFVSHITHFGENFPEKGSFSSKTLLEENLC